MSTRRKALLAGVIALVLGVVAFTGYGWWTRRSPVAYSRGGTFGSPAPDAAPVLGPTSGRYVYAATGREDVKLGALSACGWDVDRVVITVKQDAAGTVLDQRIGERIERIIYDERADGVYLTYAASTVTCLGIRTTSEDVITPPALRFRTPLVAGDSWTTTTSSPNRTEHATVTVVRTERVTVPAGTFDAVVVRLATTFTGGQTGSLEQTFWYVPARAIWVKERSRLDATQGGGRIVSSYETRLETLP